MSTSASVNVTLQVEVTVGSWGDTASFATLRDQAIREATNLLRDHLSKRSDCRIVGSPVAMHVILKGDVKT